MADQTLIISLTSFSLPIPGTVDYREGQTFYYGGMGLLHEIGLILHFMHANSAAFGSGDDHDPSACLAGVKFAIHVINERLYLLYHQHKRGRGSDEGMERGKEGRR